MNSKFQKQPDFKQNQQVQSFYEPSLVLLNKLIEQKKINLRTKGYDENNAAVTKTEFTETMARQFKITQWLAQQIAGSLIRSELIQAFGGYAKSKDGEV